MPKDKSGKKITWSEFFTRWGNGIKQVASNPSPLERVTIESRGTFINLIGFIVCFITLIIFRDKFFVSWFTYGLMLIFIGSIITTGLKYFGLREQKKLLESMETNKEVDLSEIEKEIDNYLSDDEEVEVKEQERKGMEEMGIKVEKYLEEAKGGKEDDRNVK